MHTFTAQPHRIYTNDLERERLRQDAYAVTPNRLSLNRHRIRQARARQLTVIAIVAGERRDRTIQREARDLIGLPKGTVLADTYEIIESRRPSRATRHGFASNRVVRREIDEASIAPTFPLVEDKSMAAAVEGHIV